MIDSNDTSENDTICQAEKLRDDKWENLDETTRDITPELIKLKRKILAIKSVLHYSLFVLFLRPNK